MKTVSPFRDLGEGRPEVEVLLNGAPLRLPEGMNLAAALLAAGVRSLRRTPVSGAERAPYCMMGACFDCLVEIGGVTRQACMLNVEAGMEITRPQEEITHVDG
ncbi:(2Fe-2S)-binding protein [Marimonas lutisalis]|uniref:(2Fe-2S)-binding protein n=1 Tax=Marimonas lutisalis TaxID=2545756 RepID=UPI001F470090|nr:(2Fe-2S)-binding protein [Marimonas lutisalis]